MSDPEIPDAAGRRSGGPPPVVIFIIASPLFVAAIATFSYRGFDALGTISLIGAVALIVIIGVLLARSVAAARRDVGRGDASQGQ